MKTRIVTLALAAALPFAATAAEHAHHAHHAPHWSYKGDTGPARWAELDEANKTCSIGGAQSPIDIPSAKAGASKLGAISFAYKAAPLRIIDNGHTIQVNVDGGSTITVGGQSYELKQFHFHRPSEEKIDGKAYELVAHLVHKNAEGKLAVVGVLFKNGAENPTLKTLWANLPKEKEKEVTVEGAGFNPADLLPAKRAYYNFSGSLTTPPCSEGVNWFVLKTPVEASKAQFARFAKLYPMNARPVQPLKGRAIEVGGE